MIAFLRRRLIDDWGLISHKGDRKFPYTNRMEESNVVGNVYVNTVACNLHTRSSKLRDGNTLPARLRRLSATNLCASRSSARSNEPRLHVIRFVYPYFAATRVN